jgi:hypothetical protein
MKSDHFDTCFLDVAACSKRPHWRRRGQGAPRRATRSQLQTVHYQTRATRVEPLVGLMRSARDRHEG